MSIEPAVAGDLAAIVQLLGRSGLDADGLEQHLDTTLVARRNSQLVASAGLELYGRQALMRSVVVAPQTRGITQVYLLTETAREFFARFGFRLMERADVPHKVQLSQEFSMACAQNAVAMWAPLEDVLHGFK